MFNDIKTTVLLCAVLMLGLLLAVSALSMSSLKSKNETLTNDLLQSQVSVEALLSSNDNKDERIKKLEREYRVISELNTSHRNQVADLKFELGNKLERANQLGNSEHEPTKTWANTDLPSDAMQLLKQTDCQSSDQDRNGVCPTAD